MTREDRGQGRLHAPRGRTLSLKGNPNAIGVVSAALRIDIPRYNVSLEGQQLPPTSQFYVLEGLDAVALDISGGSPTTISTVVRSVRFTH